MSVDKVETEEHFIGRGEVTFSLEELACRLAEIATECVRPEGMTAEQALDVAEAQCVAAGLPFIFRDQARAAMDYFLSEMKAGQYGRPN